MPDPIIKATPRPMKSLILSIEGNDFAAHVSQAAFVPSSQQLSWQGGKADATFTSQTPSTWVFNVNVVQDWENAAGLAVYLLRNEGKVATVKMQPNDDGVFMVKAEVTIAAPQIGGAVNAYNESSLSMGCTKPVPTYPTGTAPTAPDNNPATPTT